MTSMLRSPGTGSTGMVGFAISSRAECWELADVEVARAGAGAGIRLKERR